MSKVKYAGLVLLLPALALALLAFPAVGWWTVLPAFAARLMAAQAFQYFFSQ